MCWWRWRNICCETASVIRADLIVKEQFKRKGVPIMGHLFCYALFIEGGKQDALQGTLLCGTGMEVKGA